MSDPRDNVQQEFLAEAQELVEALSRDLLLLDEAHHRRERIDPALINEIFRSVHTLKGIAGMFGYKHVGGVAHALEDLLDDLRLGRTKLGKSDTLAVLLPGVSFFLHHTYAPARKLIEQNAIVALATDFNPGSSHISSLSLTMSLAALKMKMTIEETISAVTINSAKALCREKSIGSIEIGKKADFAVFNTQDYSEIAYSIGNNLNCITIKDGIIIYQN